MIAPQEEFPASEAIARAARLIEDRLRTLEESVHRLNNVVNELTLWKTLQQRRGEKPA